MGHIAQPALYAPAAGRIPVVLLISDVRLYREALFISLAQAKGIEVAGHCSGMQTMEWLGRVPVDVALVDASLSIGLSLGRQIRACFPSVRVLALAIGSEVGRIVECAEAGFAGYLRSDAGIDGLVEAVERVMHGELTCSPRVAGLLFERLALLAETRCGKTLATLPPGRDQGQTALTLRETEVAQLIDAGLTNKEIALELQLSPATVKNHVHSILEKLGAPRRAAIRGRLAGRRASAHHTEGSPPAAERRAVSMPSPAAAEAPGG
jgi:DNA-binding NarL/FixJ family response regulator